MLDARAVAAAVPGHDAVISALGHSRPSPAGHDLHLGASHTINAMKAARVSRLIWISSHGVGDSRGHSGFVFERIFVPLRLRAEFADKERQEALVSASDLDWTIIRPARLTNGPATRRLRAKPRLPVSISDSASRPPASRSAADRPPVCIAVRNSVQATWMYSRPLAARAGVSSADHPGLACDWRPGGDGRVTTLSVMGQTWTICWLARRVTG